MCDEWFEVLASQLLHHRSHNGAAACKACPGHPACSLLIPGPLVQICMAVCITIAAEQLRGVLQLSDAAPEVAERHGFAVHVSLAALCRASGVLQQLGEWCWQPFV